MGRIASIDGDKRRSVTNSLMSRTLSLSVSLNTRAFRKFSLRKKINVNATLPSGHSQNAERLRRRLMPKR
jgi:hypothetical protein